MGSAGQERLHSDDLADFNDTIVSRFDRQVATAPDKLALVTNETSFTYRALDREASRIAAALTSHISQRDQPIVLLFIADEAARVVSLLAALKARLIFISIAPDVPANWLAQVIADSTVTQIIVDSSTRNVALSAAGENVSILEFEQLARESKQYVSNRIASPDDTALVVYTSGSTGTPKGVAISHRSMLRNCDLRNRIAGLGHIGRFANLRSCGTYSWIRNNFSALLSGECLFPFDLHRRGLHALAPWLIEQEITHISFTASLLRTWLASLPDHVRFPALRFVGATGDRLYAQDVIRLSRLLQSDWGIGYSYSSTETGTIAAQTFTPSRLPDDGIVAVGHPVDGVEVRICDETGSIVEQGEIGEIVVRSQFLAQGYWKNQDRTAEVFQTDSDNDTYRRYRTGDLGRWRGDGNLELVGRKVRRIRLRGYSIEPFHVESELLRLPGVTDAVVVLHGGDAGHEECLVAYVVAPSNASPSSMRLALTERLPSHMVPSHIVVLDRFPIASSGKVDHHKLPPPYRESTRSVKLRSPANNRERELLAIWQTILRVPEIGIDDDFFELGGTSLQVLRMFAMIEVQLGCSLSPTTIIQAPTIASLAAHIRQSRENGASPSLIPLRASGSGLPLFLAYDRAGLTMGYRHLVADLESDRPIYGLQPRPFDGKHPIARTIESMAANCIADIRRVQPHGPFFIAGHSFGGRLSFEIAQQLTREGERVAFLGLIDTFFREMVVEGRPWMSEAVHLGRKARHVHGIPDKIFRVLRFIGRQALRGPDFIQREILFRRYDAWVRRGFSIPQEYRPAYCERLSVRANRNYVPKPFPGHIVMFSSAGNSQRQKAQWASLARGGLTVLEVPAAHNDMMLPPYSKILAGHFDTCLNIVRQGQKFQVEAV